MKPFAFILLLFACMPSLAATVEDSRGTHDFDAVPKRVVALSWSLVGQLLTLGIEPVAIADPDGYREWVGRPALPDAVAGVGLRMEPNLERIAELEPDVILASDDQSSFVPQLERIAPVLHFDSFSASHDNPEVARRNLHALARLFEREAEAERRLAEIDERLATLRQAIAEHFSDAPPRVAVVRFIDEARVVIHGDNSMPDAALQALGVANAVDLEPSKWGIAIRKVETLGRIAEGAVVLHIRPFPAGDKLFARPLWEAMPFVRAGRFQALPKLWTYGGAMSVKFLAEEIAAALLATEPQ